MKSAGTRQDRKPVVHFALSRETGSVAAIMAEKEPAADKCMYGRNRQKE
jgi:hypothetical protein